MRKQLDNKRTPLTWVQRAHIAVGAAQGLAYLHDLADPPVVHRDFKTSNILVMADYEARAFCASGNAQHGSVAMSSSAGRGAGLHCCPNECNNNSGYQCTIL